MQDSANESPVSANMKELDRLVSVGEKLGKLLIRISSCENPDELEPLYAEVVSFAKSDETNVSELSMILIRGLRPFDSLTDFETKRKLLEDVITEAKEWLYRLKQLYGEANNHDYKLEAAGHFCYDGLDFYYSGKKLDVKDQSARLLLAFMRANGNRLTRGQIERLDGPYQADSCGNRINALKNALTKTDIKLRNLIELRNEIGPDGAYVLRVSE